MSFSRCARLTCTLPDTRTVTECLAEYVNNPKSSDVTFEVEGQKVYGQRFILTIRSIHFEKMLANVTEDEVGRINVMFLV